MTHENPKSGIPELEVGEAILSHFFLTMNAELGLLNKDLEWWIHKEHFSPGITSKEEVEEAIILLKERISTIDEMLRGYLVKHLGALGPRISDIIAWIM